MTLHLSSRYVTSCVLGDKPPVPGCRNDPIVLSEDPPFSFPPPFFLRLRNSTSLVSSFVDSRPRLCVLDSNLCVILSVRTSSSSTPEWLMIATATMVMVEYPL